MNVLGAKTRKLARACRQRQGALVGLCLVLATSGCGGSKFAGKKDPAPTPVPTPYPTVEARPLSQAAPTTGSDIAILPTDGGFKNRDPKGTGVTLPGSVGNATVVTFPSNFTQPAALPAVNPASVPVAVIGPKQGSAVVQPTCPNDNIMLNGTCVPVRKLHVWTKTGTSRLFHSVCADAGYTATSASGCGTWPLAERGFAYTGAVAFVFPESAAATLTSAGLTSKQLVVCHHSFTDDMITDSFVVDPSTSPSCFEGGEVFRVIATNPGEGSVGLFQWRAGTKRALATSATVSPIAGAALEQATPVGYVVAP